MDIRQKLLAVGVPTYAITEMDYIQKDQPEIPGWFVHFDDLDDAKTLDEAAMRKLIDETKPDVGDKGLWWPANA